MFHLIQTNIGSKPSSGEMVWRLDEASTFGMYSTYVFYLCGVPNINVFASDGIL